MKKYLLYISIIILGISSCQVTKVKELKQVEHGAILDTLYGKSLDIKIASCMINIVDIETRESIPFASIEISDKQNNKFYSTNLNGFVIIPDIKEGIFDIKITYVGYETLIIKKIEFSKKNDIWLKIGLLSTDQILGGHL